MGRAHVRRPRPTKVQAAWNSVKRGSHSPLWITCDHKPPERYTDMAFRGTSPIAHVWAVLAVTQFHFQHTPFKVGIMPG